MSKYIATPRPMFDKTETLGTTFTIGGSTAGIVVRITKKGIEFNGYYASLTERAKYANMREFSLIEWEEIDKIRADIFEKKERPKKRKAEVCAKIDKPDKEYLEKLPVVTLNGKKYYIDMERKERRSVDNPEKVFNFESLATKKPS